MSSSSGGDDKEKKKKDKKKEKEKEKRASLKNASTQMIIQEVLKIKPSARSASGAATEIIASLTEELKEVIDIINSQETGTLPLSEYPKITNVDKKHIPINDADDEKIEEIINEAMIDPKKIKDELDRCVDTIEQNTLKLEEAKSEWPLLHKTAKITNATVVAPIRILLNHTKNLRTVLLAFELLVDQPSKMDAKTIIKCLKVIGINPKTLSDLLKLHKSLFEAKKHLTMENVALFSMVLIAIGLLLVVADAAKNLVMQSKTQAQETTATPSNEEKATKEESKKTIPPINEEKTTKEELEKITPTTESGVKREQNQKKIR